ncbi:MAG: hypothetical protein KIS90_05005 [Phenylobacterium sp.]|nr:hypothetical protein [Phenylobacterium sp.]
MLPHDSDPVRAKVSADSASARITTRGPWPPPAGKVETTEVIDCGVTATTRSGRMSVSRCSQASSAPRSSELGKLG